MPANTNIFARLSTDATLGPLVTNGDSPETFKIYPMFMPQVVSYPALRYQNISSEPQNTFGGESDQQNDRVQIDIYSDSYDESQTVADAVVAAMAGTGATSFCTSTLTSTHSIASQRSATSRPTAGNTAVARVSTERGARQPGFQSRRAPLSMARTLANSSAI